MARKVFSRATANARPRNRVPSRNLSSVYLQYRVRCEPVSAPHTRLQAVTGAASSDVPTGLFPAGKKQAKVHIPAVWIVLECQKCFDDDLSAMLDEAIDAGATGLVLRDSQSGGADLFRAAAQLREAIRGRIVFLVEDRADIAAACGADGVVLSPNGTVFTFPMR
jgi:hypothetical protein